MDILQKILIGIVILAGLFLTKSYYSLKNRKKRMYYALKSEWGNYTRDEYFDKLMENIAYYDKKHSTADSIDSITWNDLDMDAVFMQMNHTRTSAGEEYLYHLLHSPVFDNKELEKREKTIQAFSNHEEKRMDLEMLLYEIGKTDRISVYQYINQSGKLQKINKLPHIIALLALLISIIMLFVAPASAIALIFIVVIINGYSYYHDKAKVIQSVALFEFILGTIMQCKDICKIDLPECEEYFNRLNILSRRFKKFCRWRFLVFGGKSMTGNLLDSIMDYVRILFHVDLIKIATMIHEVNKYEKELLEIYEIIGYLDSMIAVASFRHSVKEFTTPQLIEENEQHCELQIKNMYHPLINNPVKNDLDTRKSILLTGSNASGKSTFLKAVAINAIFAQTIHTVLADSYRSNFYRIYSSMALRDDIMSSQSYFIVEIKSLKRIFENIEKSKVPVLCFIDEILRGTNTVERVAASSQLLEELSNKNVMCFAATHDIELTYLLEKIYDNYHFEEKMSESDVSFDYLLKNGRANSRNAIRLLETIGFEKDIIKKAQNRVDCFINEGVWK